MRKFFFGHKSAQSVVKNQSKTRSLRFEGLEKRELLAAGGLTISPPTTDQTAALLAQITTTQAQAGGGGGGGSQSIRQVPSPTAIFTSLAVTPQKGVLPGTDDLLMYDVNVTATRPFASVEELVFVATTADLAQNTRGFTLWADLNADKRDGIKGCETQVSYASADYETGVVDFLVWEPVWARQTPMHMVVTADINTYISSDAAGIDLVWGFLEDVRGNPVPDNNVSYRGSSAVIHTLDSAFVNLSQDRALPAQSALPGERVELAKFNVYTKDAALTSVEFVPEQGKLAYAENYTLSVDTNYDNHEDFEVPGVVSVDGSKLNFNFSANVNQGAGGSTSAGSETSARYALTAEMVDNVIGEHLQLVLSDNASGFGGVNTKTNKPLKGVIFNGNPTTPSQFRVWKDDSYSTVITAVQPEPPLVVKELGSMEPEYVYVAPGTQDMVMDSFTAYAAEGQDITMNTVVFFADTQSMGVFENFVLWFDTNNDNEVDTFTTVEPRQEGSYLYFENIEVLVGAGQSVRFDLQADAIDTVQYSSCRVGLAQDGVFAELAEDETALDPSGEVFIGHRWPKMFIVYNYDGRG